MVLEEEIPKFAAWIGPALLWYLFAASLVAVRISTARSTSAAVNDPVFVARRRTSFSPCGRSRSIMMRDTSAGHATDEKAAMSGARGRKRSTRFMCPR